MKFSALPISIFLWAFTALAADPLHRPSALNNVKNILERRLPNRPFQHPELRKRATRFLNDKTKDLAVDGTAIPEVAFDVGESYAGLLPISSHPEETRKLFFWFFPSTHPENLTELVIWLNGGPGCSSLSGLLTENGPVTWQSGTFAPVPNPYSWTNLTNMLWVEQPIGVGFSQGTPNITDEVELATQFRGFFKSFVDTFDMHGWKTYITGSSYAGYYVPYIADSFIQENDTEYFNLAGISLINPTIGDFTAQQQVVTLPYVEYWQNILYLNDTFMEQMRQRQAECNYTEYLDTYLQFPPPQEDMPILQDPYSTEDLQCNMVENLYSALVAVNPCFDIYHVTEGCPFIYSQLGKLNQDEYHPEGAAVYFNRSDVQEVLHAPVGTNWEKCTTTNVFGKGNDTDAVDASLGPALNGVLQRVIEHTNNTMIGSGNLDMLLPTNGTLLALQNMTWNGLKGLQEYPTKPLYAPYHPEFHRGAQAGSGVQGRWTHERGVTFYTAQLAGHELPGYTPGVAYRMLEILLGRAQDFGSEEGFTTQSATEGPLASVPSTPPVHNLGNRNSIGMCKRGRRSMCFAVVSMVLYVAVW